MEHFVYILRCVDGTLYTGYARDLEARLKEHNGEGSSPSAKKLGAKYTRGRRPVELVYSEKCSSRSEALKREASIKKLSRVEKVALMKGV